MLTRKIKLWDINAHITCRLCSGYLIDATTVTECLHTFCRSCLVKYLEENNTCPTCRIVIHQSHPLQYIGHDRTMQDIVYKLVPGLQEAEMRKQREFYHKLGMEVPGDIKGETCSAKQHLDPHRNGETKADDSSNKEAAEEKQEEDNDYHRSDEQLTYSVYSVLLASGVDSCDSSLTYNTQCSSQVPSSMPSPVFPSCPPLYPHHQPSVCSLYSGVFYGLPPSLFITYFSVPFSNGLLLSFSNSTYE
ncbi:polycomb group RING finger protein 3 isoform X1 [Panthera uncia]|uniref:polycomb group RING finger protein 3 isoform X1 n=1 Tax=Panthera uncia TaxID=29064 RepID=UPI0020FFAEDE|nr:polycomb group RING finger protein 3 isoform X1 [Panthera uncia]XP_049486075.1 polycomb group RING finger protein 3 isoform X1 [Panthera uncia]XP_049486076.1 polycomb group RING finger protein 3 isoform X1 [Panthera uncia]